MSVGLTECGPTEDDHIQNDAETVEDGKGGNLSEREGSKRNNCFPIIAYSHHVSETIIQNSENH